MPAAVAANRPKKATKKAAVATKPLMLTDGCFLSSDVPFFLPSQTRRNAENGLVPQSILDQFGPSRFSPHDQGADLSCQATRVLKDVLSVGKWKVGIDEQGKPILFDFTPEILKAIAENFKLAKSRKVDFNLGKTHGDPRTGLIHPDDLISPIDDVATDGQKLWMSSYVSPEQAVYLAKNKSRKVSARVVWNFADGHGNIYPIQLVHVAVTDNPIVSGQGPFIELANDITGTAINPGNGQAVNGGTSQDASRIADASKPAGAAGGDSSGDGGNTAADDDEDSEFATHRDLWNRAFGLLGLPQLPDSVDETTLPLAVDLLLGTIEPDDDGTNDGQKASDAANDPATVGAGIQTLPSLTPAIGANMPAELANNLRILFGDSEMLMKTKLGNGVNLAPDTGATATTGATPAAKPAAAPIATDPATAAVNLSNMIGQMLELQKGQQDTIVALTTQVASLSGAIQAIQTEKKTSAETAYKQKLADLAGALKITAEEVTMFTGIGPATEWNLANLAVLDARQPFASPSRFAKGAATAGAPAVTGVTAEMKPEDILAGANMLLSGFGKKLTELPAA